MSYDNNVSTKKKIKKIVNGIISMAIVIIISGIVVLNMYATKVNKLKEADIKIETIKLENAIKDYKSRTGSFPALKGNENGRPWAARPLLQTLNTDKKQLNEKVSFLAVGQRSTGNKLFRAGLEHGRNARRWNERGYPYFGRKER